MLRPYLLSGFTALSLTLTAPLPSLAQTDSAAQSLINRLLPSASRTTRGIRMPGEAPSEPPAAVPVVAPAMAKPAAVNPATVPVQTAATAVRPPVRETTSDAPSASITVNFATGSAALRPEAVQALAPLGRALSSSDLAAFRFRIEGHTDTVGDDAQNLTLSEQRAAAVRDHLVQVFQVDPARLEVKGLGATQLLIPTPPQTPQTRNRRVQVVNLGS